tara:strand:+ start:189 stop:299 length:111 start_codon:yes stop_codon:yes gene_type:complete
LSGVSGDRSWKEVSGKDKKNGEIIHHEADPAPFPFA